MQCLVKAKVASGWGGVVKGEDSPSEGGRDDDKQQGPPVLTELLGDSNATVVVVHAVIADVGAVAGGKGVDGSFGGGSLCWRRVRRDRVSGSVW